MFRATCSGPLRSAIAFVHVPKCAGTSVDRAIRRVYRSPEVFEGHGIFGPNWHTADRVAAFRGGDDWAVRDIIACYYLERAETRYMTGHFRVGESLLDRFGEDYAFVTVLRDPVERWLSHFFFDRQHDQDHAYGIEQSLEAFVESERARRRAHIYQSYFSGCRPREDEEFDAGDDALARAKANLRRFEIVGFVEQLDEFAREFRERLGGDLRLIRVNRTPDDARRSEVPDEIRARIREMCQKDIELYEFARDEFGE
ncbi:MAG: sulfotransferase family 2 domain-containing protein [Bradymonadaceae bacterium]